MDRKVFTAILLSLVVVGLIALTVVVFRPFFLALLWAATLATVTHGSYAKLATAWGRPALASVVMTALVVIVIIGPVVAITFLVFRDAATLFQRVAGGEFNPILERVQEHPIVQRVLEHAGKEGSSLSMEQIATKAMENILAISKTALGIALWPVFFAMNILFMVLGLFYFYKDGPDAADFLRDLIPLRREDSEKILSDIRAAMVAAVRGGLLTALCQGALGFVILLVLDISQPVFWSFLIALASLIPIVGTAIVWAPMAAVLYFQGDQTPAIVLAAYGAIVIGGSDNFLRPIFVGQDMHVHPMLLFFGILGGVGVFGFLGIILGPIVVAFLNVTVRLLHREFTEEREAEGVRGTEESGA